MCGDEGNVHIVAIAEFLHKEIFGDFQIFVVCAALIGTICCFTFIF